MKFGNAFVNDKINSILHAKIFQTRVRVCDAFLNVRLVFAVIDR